MRPRRGHSLAAEGWAPSLQGTLTLPQLFYRLFLLRYYILIPLPHVASQYLQTLSYIMYATRLISLSVGCVLRCIVALCASAAPRGPLDSSRTSRSKVWLAPAKCMAYLWPQLAACAVGGPAGAGREALELRTCVRHPCKKCGVAFDWPQLAAGVVGAVAVAGVRPRGARACGHPCGQGIEKGGADAPIS